MTGFGVKSMGWRVRLAILSIVAVTVQGLVLLPGTNADPAHASGADLCSSQAFSNVTIATYLDGSDCLVAFKAGNGSWTVPEGVTLVNYLVVGGGGGGGSRGGGGAGAFVEGEDLALIPGNSVSVMVGSGGVRGSGNRAGGNGGHSQFASVLGFGGGGGSSAPQYNTSDVVGERVGYSSSFTNGEGGSGGGGMAVPQNNWDSCVPTGQSNISALGAHGGAGGLKGSAGTGHSNNGGDSQSICYRFTDNRERSFWIGGGGGGAGQVGSPATWVSEGDTATNIRFPNGTIGDLSGPGFVPGAGGDGKASVLVVSSSAAASALGIGENVSGSIYFAGGGGGAANYNSSGGLDLSLLTFRGLEGYGGRGGGALIGNAAANTGGGGSARTPGDGGSGVVVIRYSIPKTLTLDIGTSSSTQSLQAGVTPSITQPTRAGYSLAGWSSASPGAVDYLADLSDFTMGSQDITLYAVWESTLAITTPSSGLGGVAGSPYSLQVAASGGAGSLTWSATGLPTGLTISPTSGEISGTPTSQGTSSVSVTVTDSDSNTATTNEFVISIAGVLSNVGTPTVTATAGVLKSFDVSWAAVQDASSYTLKVFDSDGTTLRAAFSIDNSATSFQVSSSNFAGIADGTQYKVSLQAVGTGNFVTSNESWQASVTTLQTFTITFSGNGQGAGNPPTDQTKIEGVDLTLPGNTGSLSRDGYNLLGWNTASDGSGTTYSLSATLSADASVSLFAHWSPIDYTITWDSNGGSAVSSPATFNLDHGIQEPTAPNKNGFVFAGWSTTDNGDSGALADKIGAWPYAASAANQTLYAIWITSCDSYSSRQFSLVNGVHYTTLGYWRAVTCAHEIPSAVTEVDVLVVGGGGGGGANVGGGGAGGGVFFKSDIDVSSDRIVVASPGAGGAGGTSGGSGQNGATSTVNVAGQTFSANGGSGGTSRTGANAAGGTISSGSDAGIGGQGASGGRSATVARTSGGSGFSGSVIQFFSVANVYGSGGGGGGWAETWLSVQSTSGGSGGGTGSGTHGQAGSPGQDFLGAGGGGGATSGNGARGGFGTVGVRYESLRFPLTFSSGVDGSGADQIVDKIDGVTLTLPGSADANNWFSRTGYTVTGWSTTDGGSQTHALGGSYTPNESEEFFPVWTLNVYTITFSAGVNGTGADFSVTKSHGVDINLPDSQTANANFTRNGFEVFGWSTTSAGLASDFDLGATYSGNEDAVLYPYWRELAIEAREDTTIRSGSNSGTNYGYSYQLDLKNAQAGTFNNNNRVTYLKFKYDPGYTWSGAVLEVYSTFNDAGSAFNPARLDSTAYGTSYTTFNVEVFAVSDASWNEDTLTFNSADASSQGWGLDTSTWPWGIDNGTYVGNLAIPADPDARHGKFSMSTSELDDFLNSDSDGEITLFLRRTDLDADANLSIASSEHYLFPGPTLFNAGSGQEYRVSYDINGGSGQLPVSGVYTEGGSAYTIATTSGIIPPANSSIIGWNTKRDGTGTAFAFGDSYSSTKSMTLYAIYELNPEVTFFSNYSGGPATVSQFVTPSTNTALRKNTFTRTGYTFTGWATQANGGGQTYADQANINTSADEDLYAQWSANTYTVLYDYKGADGGDSDVSDSFVVDSGNHITLPVPSKTGHNFGGWFENSNLSGTALGATYSPTQNITLTAKWNAIDYRIYYNTTNGTGTAPTDSKTYNYSQSAVVLANTALTRLGYRFGGWTINSDGSGTALNAGDTIAFATANDIQLYPKWIANNYSISYNLNGGSGSLSGAPTSYSPATGAVTLPSTGFTKIGYDFDGWAITQNGQAVPYANFTTFTNITLYAVWDIKNISYTFDKGTATGQSIAGWPTGSSANYASTFSLPTIASTPVTIGGQPHIFSGWSDGTNTYQGGSSYLMGATSPTFTALWSEVYDVSYVFAGGTLAGETDADDECVTSGLCTNGQQITLHLSPSRTGYQFDGWKVQDTATIKAGGASHIVSSSAYIFYAQWTAIDYVMSFDSNFGSNNIASSTNNIGQQLVMPNPGTRTGYTFTGWSPDAGVTLLGIGATYTVGNSSKTFVAQWTPNTYTVTYDWQGGQAVGAPKVSDDYTVGTGNLSLPPGASYTRDGFEFEGWALTSNSPTLLTNFQPTQDVVLYAIWRDGNFTISYDGQGAQAGSGVGTIGRGQSANLPTPVRQGFVFLGWYTHPTAGAKVGDGAQPFTPNRSQTLYARWVQRSLFGVDLADLETAATLTVGSGGIGGSFTKNSAGKPTATVTVPNGALPDGTVVTARYFSSLDRQAALIQDDNALIFSLMVSWLNGDGTSATVPDTDPNIPITVTFNSDAIRIGQMIYKVVGDQVTELGRATTNGTITVELYEDPEIVLAATAPSTPTGITASPRASSSLVSWNVPGSDGGSPITGYTATANPGGESCTTTTTSCTINNLVNGTNYTFEVVAHNAIGSSTTSSPSAAVSPALRTFTATFDSNSGSAVAAVSFVESTLISAPANPTRAGFTFDGWSTFLNVPATKVTFPYQSSDQDITFYALWVASPQAPTQDAIRSETPPGVSPTVPTPIVLNVSGSAVVKTNELVRLVGTNFNLVEKVLVGEIEASFFVSNQGLLTIRIPVEVAAGKPAITLQGAFGSRIFANLIEVSITQVSIDTKVTIGTFLGFAAVYTKNHEGKRLSMKIGSKWRVIKALGSDYTYNFTKVGKGKTVTVMVYLDRVLVQVKQIKIQ